MQSPTDITKLETITRHMYKCTPNQMQKQSGRKPATGKVRKNVTTAFKVLRLEVLKSSINQISPMHACHLQLML